MRLDVPYKLMERIDAAALLALADKLAPLYRAEDAPVWSTVRERSAFIGKEQSERPEDIGFRKMIPVHYVQLCILNDELPFSPWALTIPEAVLPAAEAEHAAATMKELCAKHYGDGELYFFVLAVLGPHGVIPPHRDMPHDINKKAYSHHLHIPLTHASECEFTLGEHKVVFDAGGVYEINNMDVHGVLNEGEGYRVNVMLDYCPREAIALRNAPSPEKPKRVSAEPGESPAR